MKKMRWNKPQLVVLLRGRPEEAVLTNCRQSGNATGATKGVCGSGTRCTTICSARAGT